MPFIFPNPFVATNIQPYAALLGTLILLMRLYQMRFILRGRPNTFIVISFATFLVALLVLFVFPITTNAFRALYNYFAVAVIPLATLLVLRRIKCFPEHMVKVLILIWFAVSTIQFFINRSFLTGIVSVSDSQWSDSTYRGVVGLASEPSFFGIACFYFLHMALHFKTNRLRYVLIILVMGVLYAQSTMGILFIAAFFLTFLLDIINTWRGIGIWIASIVGIGVFFVLLNTVLAESRLHDLLYTFLEGGSNAIISGDASAEARFNSILNALGASLDNFLMPLGYTMRIGSGYGGFLCELGLFAIPVIVSISYAMSLTFNKKTSKVLYFLLVTVLMFNNTQVGNPLLLFVVGTQLAFRNIHSRFR
jgi:hypothetical protein